MNLLNGRTAVVNSDLAEKAGIEKPARAEWWRKNTSRIWCCKFLRIDYLPKLREYAAQALIGTQWLEEMQTHQRIYPWDGHALRNPYGKQMGYFLANFKRWSRRLCWYCWTFE